MEYDIIILGAGPAGCALALHLANTDFNILLIDKESFPRRKVCGGALSERALNQLKEFPKELNIYKNFLNSVNKVESYGLRVFTPNEKILTFDYKDHNDEENIPGYVCNRSEFDDFMVGEVRKHSNIELITGITINNVEITKDKVIAKSSEQKFIGKFIVGADGANSVLRKEFPSFKKVNDIGISCHFENVSGFHKDNLIDMYFLEETLPGYFWIFNLPENKVNVGIYTTKEKLKKKKQNLKSMINNIITDHPEISCRFKDAKQLDESKGWKLPILFKRVLYKKNLYGHRHLFIGDAASLIDPITGEGIGNALVSGNFAAKTIIKTFKNGKYDQKGLDIYRRLLCKKFRYEFFIHSISRSLFKNSIVLEICFSLIKNLKLFNSLISKRLYK